MKRLIFVLTLFSALIAGTLWQASARMPVAIVAGGVPVAGASYLVTEDFDGAVGCKAGSAPSNCTNQWTVSPGGYAWGTFDTSSGAIEGTYSHQTAAADQAISVAFTATSPVYAFLKMKASRVSDDTDNVLYPFGGYISISADADGTGFYLRTRGCGTGGSGTSKLTYGTVYNVWIEYTKGSGANSKLDLYVSSSTTKGAVASTYSDGNCTADVTEFYIGGGLVIQSAVLTDHIRISSTQQAGVPD
jgi:hypothetical protein